MTDLELFGREGCKIINCVNLNKLVERQLNKASPILKIPEFIYLPKPESMQWQKTTVFTNPEQLEKRLSSFGQVIDTTQFVISGNTLPVPQIPQVLRELTLNFYVDDDLKCFANMKQIESFLKSTTFSKNFSNPQIFNIQILKDGFTVIQYDNFRLYSININRSPFGTFNNLNKLTQLTLSFKESYSINIKTINDIRDLKKETSLNLNF